MFHDSTNLKNIKNKDIVNRRCLHCGHRWGDHIGKLCPSAPITDEEIYLHIFGNK